VASSAKSHPSPCTCGYYAQCGDGLRRPVFSLSRCRIFFFFSRRCGGVHRCGVCFSLHRQSAFLFLGWFTLFSCSCSVRSPAIPTFAIFHRSFFGRYIHLPVFLDTAAAQQSSNTYLDHMEHRPPPLRTRGALLPCHYHLPTSRYGIHRSPTSVTATRSWM
jgi:hypothetical protein